jgi:hypothetical protein
MANLGANGAGLDRPHVRHDIPRRERWTHWTTDAVTVGPVADRKDGISPTEKSDRADPTVRHPHLRPPPTCRLMQRLRNPQSAQRTSVILPLVGLSGDARARPVPALGSAVPFLGQQTLDVARRMSADDKPTAARLLRREAVLST